MGSYRRTFTVPEAWQGRRVYINFDGVDSFFYLWINGKYVGFSKNSRSLAAFDITPYLQRGRNLVAVEVYRSSDGSFLETQDMFRLPGIIRSVYLTAKPQVQLRDVQAVPRLDAQYRSGVLSIKAELRNTGERAAAAHRIDYSLYSLPLYSDEGAMPVGGAIARSEVRTLPAAGSQTLEAEIRLSAPKLWSAEAPHRYILLAELRDAKGRLLEVVSTYTGFRQVEIKDVPAEADEFGLAGRYFLVNGKPIKLKGVNRHETNPHTGHAISHEQMHKEVMLMKRANINHVRNSHYPTAPYFYYLADKYGIYLEDEANIESHLYYYGKESLSHVPEFALAHTNRMLEMVRANINSPSIVIWSLGNEAGPGENFVKSYRAAKAVDASRPIQYERNNAIVDMGSNQYPSITWVQGAVQGRFPIKYPFHISEYAHSMGNAVGGLQDYWTAIESTNFICGGAIWDWVDQSIYNYTSEGKPYLAYGGDFGDTPNSGMFVMNGIVFADLEPKPQYYEVKKVYQGIGISSEGITSGGIVLHNKHYFTDLSADYTLRWSLYEDGVQKQQGRMALPPTAPRSSVRMTIPYKAGDLQAQSEYFIKIELLTKRDMPWAEAGYTQAEEQILLQSSSKRTDLAAEARGKTRVTQGANLTVVGQGFEAVFDTKQGTLHSLAYDGKQVIEPGCGPRISTFRAPCDNDIWAWGSWGANGLHNMRHRVLRSAHYQRADGATIVIFSVESQAPNGAKLYDHRASGRYRVEEQTDRPLTSADFKVNTEVVWSVYPDGSIEVQSNITSSNDQLALGRLGYELVLPRRLERYTYYGRGPVNNYPDRKTSQFIEVHKSTVREQFVNFPKPQTMGNREDVRWASLTEANGSGVLFVAGGKMSVSALPWSAMELMKAPHPHELPPAGDTHLHLDASVNGLGGFSCGQGPPLRHCQSFATAQRFAFAIRPLRAGDDAGAKARVRLMGESLPLIDRNLQGIVEVKSPKGTPLLYSLSGGRAQAYKDGVDLSRGGTIKIWRAENPRLFVERTYSKARPQLSVHFVSNEEVHEGFDAGKLIDGDANTIWHTTYSVTVGKYPHWVDFDAHLPTIVKGFVWTPRPTYTNGDVKDYSLSVSQDGKQWQEVARGAFDESKTPKRVMLSQPTSARYIRFTALSAHNGQDYAAGAEFAIVTD